MNKMKVVIVIDMQNDFINGTLGTPEAAAIVSKVTKRIETAAKDELILFTQDTHQSNYLETPEGKKLPVIHCIEGTQGWELHPQIKTAWEANEQVISLAEPNDHIFLKDVFGSTELVAFLQAKQDQITEIELLGVCTDICVVSNGLMIKNTLPELAIKVNKDCCAGATPQSHEAALEVMKMCHIEVF